MRHSRAPTLGHTTGKSKAVIPVPRIRACRDGDAMPGPEYLKRLFESVGARDPKSASRAADAMSELGELVGQAVDPGSAAETARHMRNDAEEIREADDGKREVFEHYRVLLAWGRSARRLADPGSSGGDGRPTGQTPPYRNRTAMVAALENDLTLEQWASSC